MTETVVHEYLPAGPGHREPCREGKFVQLRLHGREHLCLAPRGVASFHAQIVERFCHEQGIPSQKDADGHVQPPGDTLVVVGGGRYRLDEPGCTLQLHGTSLGYGRFDGSGLRRRLAAWPGLAGYTILVEPA